jgi:hypothetical protein
VKAFFVLLAALCVAASAAVAIAPARAPAAASAAPAKLTICHRTSSATNAWQRLVVSSRAVSNSSSAAGKTLWGHLRHIGDVVIVGTASCSSNATSTAPARSSAAPAKVTICHRTGSASNPYRRITVSSRAVTTLRGHMRHAGDILMPGTAACPSGTSTGGGGAVRLTATLQPVAGATGSGSATVTIQVGQGQLCFTLTVTGLTDVTAAHIHRESTGAVVVPFTAPTSGSSSGCVDVDKDLLREIQSTPGAFYVNVHTMTFPNGQVRGNLTR